MSQVIDEKVIAPNPFPGLRPFKIDESHLFFGREGQSDEVLLKLSKNRFVGIIGPSGSGKSSFIYCGVMPILYGGFLTDASPNWEVIVTRPGAGPIDNLADALLKNNAEYGKSEGEEKKIKKTIFSTLLRSSSLGLVEAVEQTRKKADVNYLILVDQFEELFRFKDSQDANSINETLAFINLLMEAVNYPDAPIYVAITMRSDFIGDCAQFPELTRKINDSHYLIPQLTRDQKRKAIEGPTAVGGAKIAPRLVQQLLNDLGDNPDQLPILQHALMRTWSYWASYRDFEEEPVDLKHYEAIGTMSEALSQHANEAFDELTEEQKHICEILFKAITEKRGENFGIRRPTRLNEVAAIADVSEAEVVAVIDKFREPGRSLLTPAYGTTISSKSMVDISHESLMRIWVRLKNWVDDEAEAVQMYTRLAEAASMYQVGKAGLWRPPDLQLALNWQAKHKPTLVWGQRYNPAFERTLIFLEYSRKEWETEQRIKELEAKRKLQRARIFALVLGTFTIIAIIFLVFALYQKTLADAETLRANNALVKATASEKLALAEKARAEEAKQLADKARDEAVLAQEAEAEQRKIAENNRVAAEKNSAEARRQTLIAKENENKANLATEEAKRNAERADKNAQDANRRRFIAIAKAMAIKSKSLNHDIDQQSVIAQQAFIFNDRYNDYKYDDDIYNGLYFALKSQKHALTQSLEAHENGAARALVTHAASNQIYSAGSDGKIIRWNASGDSWSKEVLVDNPGIYQYYSLAISPDGKWLAAAGMNSTSETNNYVELYELNNIKAAPKKITGYVYGIENLIFTPASDGFYARDNSGHSVKFCDLKTSKEIIKSTLKLHAIALSPDGKVLAGAAEIDQNSGSLIMWDTQQNFASKEVKNISSTLTAVDFNRMGTQIVVGDNKGIVKLYDVRAGMVLRVLAGHKSVIEQITFNHAGTFMATASKDQTVRLWNVSNLKEQPIVFDDHSDWVWSTTFSPNDEQLMASVHSSTETVNGKEHTIRAWPTKIERMSDILCGMMKRNMTDDEWDIHVADDIKKELTCPSLPSSYKND